MNNQYGWITLNRKITSHWVWNCEPYSKAHAWLDLLLYANHSDTKIILKGVLIELKRGQQARSQVTLAEQWGWSRDKVKRFIKTLENDGMISHQTSQLTSIITIYNYASFQDIKVKTSQHISEQASQQASQHSSSRQVTVNNDNNDNNENEYIFICKNGEFKATEDYVSSLLTAYPKLDVINEFQKMNLWLLANPSKQKTVNGMKSFITKWLNRATPKINIPANEIAQAYNECFARPLDLNDCEEMTEARIQSAAKIWFRKIEGEKRTDNVEYFRKYFTYCSTREGLSGVVNNYAPTIDRLLRYETYIKSIEDAYQCQK